MHPFTIESIKTFLDYNVDHKKEEDKKSLKVVIPLNFPKTEKDLVEHEHKYGKDSLEEYQKYAGEKYLLAEYNKEYGYFYIKLKDAKTIPEEFKKLVSAAMPKRGYFG